MSKIIQYTCPLCGMYPAMALGGTAFCDNEDCKTISWNMSKTLDELLTNVNFLSLKQSEEKE